MPRRDVKFFDIKTDCALNRSPCKEIRWTPQSRQWKAPTEPNQRLSYILDNEKVLGVVMIAPAVLYILALVGYPLVLAFLYSLSDITIGSSHFSFVGLEIIQTLIGDFDFRTALKNTIYFTASR